MYVVELNLVFFRYLWTAINDFECVLTALLTFFAGKWPDPDGHTDGDHPGSHDELSSPVVAPESRFLSATVLIFSKFFLFIFFSQRFLNVGRGRATF